MKALVEPSGRVAQIAAESFPVAPPLQWIDCDETVTTGHSWDGNAFVAPAPAPTMAYWEQRKELYRERIAAYKGVPEASHLDVVGFVIDAQIKAQAGDTAELADIAVIVQGVKADVPKPA